MIIFKCIGIMAAAVLLCLVAGLLLSRVLQPPARHRTGDKDKVYIFPNKDKACQFSRDRLEPLMTRRPTRPPARDKDKRDRGGLKKGKTPK